MSAVEDSDWSKIGSVEFLLLRRFHYYHFQRLGLSWKNTKELKCVVVRRLKQRTKRPKKISTVDELRMETQYGPVPDIVADGGHERTDSDQDVQRGGGDRYKDNLGYDTQMDHGGQNEVTSTTAQDEPRMSMVLMTKQPALQTMMFVGQGIFSPVQIRDIDCATYFLPKTDPASKGYHGISAGHGVDLAGSSPGGG
ncbi:hypothetical protein F511_36427 [Dorcoceras hygrometricum]|uniref:Uncharacterized protein n=1 Tax=Dorcoceras hygrometricum TaxID=472368 RepID=A0A2Z7AKD5_9LAMI|nr:hypothetical protein F511_36427 [Dorcoceras hygrometricum]